MATTNDGWETVPSTDTTNAESSGSEDGWETVQQVEESNTDISKLSDLEWVQNQFKVGATEGVALLSAAARVGVVDPVKMLVGGKVEGDALERFFKALQENQGTMLDITGGDPSQTKGDGPVSDMFGAGIRAVADPTSYIGGKPVLKGLEAFLSGMAADTGSKVGGQVEKAITGEEDGVVGKTIGALGGSVASIPVTASLEQTTKSAIEGFNKRGEMTENVVNKYAQAGRQDLAEQVANQEGIDRLKQNAEDFTNISDYIGAEDGIPNVIANANNASIKQNAFLQARSNPDFRAELDAQRVDIDTKLEAKLEDTFGARFSPIEGDLISQQAKDISSNLESSIKVVNKQIDNLSNPYKTAVGANEKLGSSISNLVDAKKKLVSKKLQPVYTKILKEAKEAGATMPKEGVESVYNHVVENNITDVFGKGTALDKKITAVFRPRQVEVDTPLADRQILFSKKLKPNKTVSEFPEATFDNVDSLKREINRLQRGRLAPNEERLLRSLEDKVDEARELIPGNFNQRLKDVDKSYYEELGIPYGTQGIKDIDSKKYAEQVSPVITKNGTAMSDFLNVVGPEEGRVIARNAILSEVDAKFINAETGEFNKSGLIKYVKDKADVIDQIPMLKEELESVGQVSELLKVKKASLQKSLNLHDEEIAKNSFTNLGGVYSDYNKMVGSSLASSRGLLRLEQDMKNLSAGAQKSVKNVLRRELIEIARQDQKGAVAFFADKKNSFVVERLMGKEYASDIAKIAKLSDALRHSDLSKVNFAAGLEELDPLKQMVGVNSQYLFSQFRDRISSIPQKVFRVGSKAYETRAKGAFDAEISGFLFDKNWVHQLGKVSDGLDTNPQGAIMNFMRLMGNKVPARSLIASKTLLNAEENSQEEQK